MDDNVIFLSQRLTSRGTDAGETRGPRDAEERHRIKERMRLREIQNVCNNKNRTGGQLKWRTLDDRLRAAMALGELKDELIKQGKTVAAVKESFPKIHRYIIEPEIDHLNSKTARILAKTKIGKVQPYLEAAKAIAKVADLDLDESQIRVLRTTSVWQDWGRSTAKTGEVGVADEAADSVAFLVERLSARIIRDTNLAKLFARMRRVPGLWNNSDGQFSEFTYRCLINTAFDGEWCDPESEAPPLPSVPLVRWWHLGLTGPVRLARTGTNPLSGAGVRQSVSEEEGDEVPAEVRFFREIRLALGPTVNSDTLGPLFESRAYAELCLLDQNGKSSRSGPLNLGDVFSFEDQRSAVLLDDLWFRITPLATVERDPENDVRHWEHAPLAPKTLSLEQYYTSWTPFDAAHVAHWLDRVPNYPESAPVEFLPASAQPKPVRETWYPQPYLAHLVETAIADGRIETALQVEIARIHDAFEKHQADWKNRMQEQTAEQTAQYDSDLLPSDTLDRQPTENGNDQEP